MDASRIAAVAAGLLLLPVRASAQPALPLPTFGMVAPGNQHTCAVLAGGAQGAGVGVDCWGRNQAGQLGDFTTTDRPRPVPVMSLTDAVTLSTDFQHVCVLTDIRTAQCWGDNTYGQVGNGTSGNLWLGAVDVCASGTGFDCSGGVPLTGVAQVATGDRHSCALLTNGHIRCWGDDFYGQLGNGQSGTGAGALLPVEVSGLTNMAAVWAGGDNTCAITNPTGPQSTRQLFCWGNNFSGQLGIGAAPTTPLASGETCPTTATPDAKCVSVPVAVPGVGSILEADPGQTTCARTSTGGVKCWGFNAHGEVGNGTVVTNPNPSNPVFGYAQPTPVDVLSTPGGLPLAGVAAIAGQCALIVGGAVDCWGDNFFGSLGDGTTTDRTTPVLVQFDGEATAIGAGSAHNCAVMSTGGIKCWGVNDFGQLGTGSGLCYPGTFLQRACSPLPVDVCLSGDAELIGLEVNQAVQSWRNSVPLLTGKATIVRAHVQPQGTDPVRVVAKLRGFRGGVELPGSPLSAVNPGSSIVAMADPASRRTTFKDALDWLLPDSWTSGAVDLRVESCADLTCSEPGETGGTTNGCTVHVMFQDATTPKLALIGLTYRDAGGVLRKTGQRSLDEVGTRLLAMFPVSTIDYTTAQLTLPRATRMDAHPRPFTDDALNALEAYRKGGVCNDPCDRIYAGIYTSPTDIVAGLANISPTVIVNDSVASFSPLTARGGYNFAQEIAHNLGLGHTVSTAYTPVGSTNKQGPCGEAGFNGAAEPDWPYIYTDSSNSPNAAIGPFNMGEAGKMFGFDSENVRIADPTMDFDVMSYCGSSWEWISDVTYNNLISAMARKWPPPPAAPAVPRAAAPAPYAIVRGMIDLDTSAVELLPFGRADLASVPAPPDAGVYTLETRDGGGNVLASIPFGPMLAYVGAGEDSPLYTFAIEAPAPPELAEVRILQGGQVLASRMASPHAPTVQVLSPNGGETLSGPTVTFSWTAADVDGDALAYTVEYSADGGATWLPLAVDATDTTLDVDLEWLAGTTTGLIRVKASDGFDVGSDVSDAFFTVPNQPPTVAILPPTGTVPIVGEETVVLRGIGHDREDGRLAGPALHWTSDLSGDLGTGETVLLASTALVPGTHTITLTGMDVDGHSATATVPLRVVRSGPVCGDGELDPGEQCDDGNLIAGDGCEPDCTVTPPPSTTTSTTTTTATTVSAPTTSSSSTSSTSATTVSSTSATSTSTTSTTTTSTTAAPTTTSTTTTTVTTVSAPTTSSSSTSSTSATTVSSTSATSTSTISTTTSSTTAAPTTTSTTATTVPSTSSSTVTTTTVSSSTTSTTLGCVADRLTCICRAGFPPRECQGQPVPPGIRKKFEKACRAVARLTTGTPAHQKKLHRAAETNFAKARALANKAGRKKISGDCARAIVDGLS